MTMLQSLLIFCISMLASLELCRAGDGQLLFELDKKVYTIPASTSANDDTTEAPTKLANFTQQPLRMACDARRNELFWSLESTYDKKIYKSSLDNNGTVLAVANTGLENPKGVAYDWITGNVYLIDGSRILVCKGGLSVCSILVSNIAYQPAEIALDPNQGLLFWTELGDQPVIMRASMDGSSPKPIVSTDMEKPNGICVDIQHNVQKRRVFWIDGTKCESVRIDGSDRRTVFTEEEESFHRRITWIGVLNGRVFWSVDVSYVWSNHAVFADTIANADKETGLDNKILYKEDKGSHHSLHGLVICHPDNQPIYRLNNPCADSGCSHICTLSFESGYRCLCPLGMILDKGEHDKSCVDSPTTSPFLYVADQNEIRFTPLHSIGRIVFKLITIPELESITSLAHNPTKHTSLILSDSDQKKIYGYDLSTKKLELLVEGDIQSVVDMDIDPIGENLYWADAGKQTVEVMSLRTKAKVMLITVENPLDIAVVPELGSIFISGVGTHGGKIFKYQLNGVTSTLQLVHENHPIALTYDHDNDRVLWIYKVRRIVQITSLSTYTIHNTTTRLDGPILDGIIFEDNAYWLDSSSQELKLASKVLASNFSGYSKMAVSQNMTSPTLQELLTSHECSWTNPQRKNCSHICLLTGKGNRGECHCPEGYHVGDDGLTCAQIVVKVGSCLHNQFRCGDGSCIRGSFVCDGVPDCGGGGREDEADSLCNGADGGGATTSVVVLSVITSLLIVILGANLLVGYWLYRNNAMKAHVNMQSNNKPAVCIENNPFLFEEDSL